MSKINVRLPKINRVSATDSLAIVFQTDFVTADGINGGGQITVKLSDTEDFAFSDTVTPLNYNYNDDGGDTWTTVSGNSIPAGNLKKYLRVSIDPIGAERAKYAKVVYTEGAKVYESTPFIVSSFTEINFLLSVPIDFGNTRPKKVKVTGKIIASNPVYTIKVEACNNPFDAVPIWEDITAEYLAKKFHLFANRIKESGKNWGIRVRFSIKKQSTADSIEISEFCIGYIK